MTNDVNPAVMTAALLFLGLVLVACFAGSSGLEPAARVDNSSNTTSDGEARSAATVVPVASPTLEPVPVELPNLGSAPEITNEVWINTNEPVTLASSRGKVVLLEFWTFGCINCQRVIPLVREWYDKYNGADFTVISVHYPEFAYEREYDNVVAATERLEIEYPVAIDNDRVTWAAYNQRFWPTTYLIDKNGRIRYKHIGEFSRSAREEAEAAIQHLMAEPDSAGSKQ